MDKTHDPDQEQVAQPAPDPLHEPNTPPSPMLRMIQMRRASGLTGQNVVQFHLHHDVQARSPSGLTGPRVQEAAARGTSGASAPLPHRERLQEAFGDHDLSGVRAFVGGAAREASDQMGALAFATGDAVAFRDAPDLHTAAHEAAHIIQQRGGVSLQDGVGAPGDRYERHADAVADAVVAGRTAQPLLDQLAPRATAATARAQVQQRRNALGGYDPSSRVARDYDTLLTEQERALTGMRAQQTGTRTGTYGDIFEDAKAFAAQLQSMVTSHQAEAVQLASGVSLTLSAYGTLMGHPVASTIQTNLSNPKQAEDRAKAHIDAGGDVFGAFEGRWQGQWHNRAADGSDQNVGTFDHDWQATAPADAGSDILAQPVVMGAHDPSVAAPAHGSGAQTSRPDAAINAVDRQTGMITGAVGVSGGAAQRPHAGYFVDERTLIWVARESNDPDNVLYSCFFEHRRPDTASSGTSGTIPAGGYVIMGLQFRWSRASRRATFERLMGGLYTTPPGPAGAR
jgi:hypothetical protein